MNFFSFPETSFLIYPVYPVIIFDPVFYLNYYVFNFASCV